MIKPATRALAKDALYQVLDNGVFRILAIAALLPVLIFSVIRVTADEFQLLFGMKSWDLNYMAAMAAPEGSSDPQASVLGFLLDQVFFSFPGTFGVLFCLCAASFFVPKMLEKGAVDVIFHKPISRTRFFLSRYVTGLLFVALLTSVSATGVFLALLLVSGFTDVGVFAVIPAMTYLFGVIYPVTMVVGLLTRSTVAALLLSAVFYLLNGAIQVTWISIEISSQDALSQLSSGSGLEVTIETSGGESTDEDSADFQEDEDEANVWLDAALMTLDIAHFSL
ncbi:MAG: ABC-type transport system involved in multi-copper enzyme maturation permease subunit, partial [Planctomycetota bacterium]